MKNVLLINAALMILFLSETYVGSTHDKRIAEATPYPLPAGSWLLQDLGFLAFTLDQVEMIMPTKKPRGQALARGQKAANRRIVRRRVHLEHVNSSVKRCRIVHDTSRFWKIGVRDLVMNWLRVLGTAELPHIDQGVRQQCHTKMSLLNMFKTQEKSLELVLPRKCPIHTSAQGMDRCIEQTFSSPLHVLSIARILFDIGDHARIEHARAIVRGIKSSVEIQRGSSKVQTGRFGYPLSGLQTLG